MALSKIALSGAALMLLEGVSAKSFTFPVYDTQDNPTEFRDGTPTYVRVTRNYNADDPPLEQFLLCTSCTISYIFGEPDDYAEIKSTEKMSFKKDKNGKGTPVECQFATVDLQLYEDNDEQTPHNWSMDVCFISPEYQSSTYFNFFKENMLGLNPMASDDESLLARQFLHQFVTTGDQKDLGLEESYAFDGGSTVTIGGTDEEFSKLDSLTIQMRDVTSPTMDS